MAEKILMLALSPTMETGTVAKWLKKEGDPVKPGDILCEVETDKATMDYETQAQGVLLKILVPQGSDSTVGSCIAIVGNPGEDISSLANDYPVEPNKLKPTAITPSAEIKEVQATPEMQAEDTQKVRATPLARKLARGYNINIDSIKGTGPNGRITEQDVEKAAGKS
jgi:pyruvate dehydrogenase E2 component (dihydrolipoamide acetyltransferase)